MLTFSALILCLILLPVLRVWRVLADLHARQTFTLDTMPSVESLPRGTQFAFRFDSELLPLVAQVGR